MTWSRSFDSSFASASARRQCGRVRAMMSRVEAFQFGAREPVTEAELRREKRQRDFHCGFGGKFDLGLLGGFANSGEHSATSVAVTSVHAADVRAPTKIAARLNFFQQKFHQPPVHVIAAEPRVAVGGEHLENAFVQFQNRKVERAAAQVINGDFRLLLQLVQAVGQRGGGGFVEDALDREAGEFAGALGRVALRVIEIRGHGDDGARDGFAKIISPHPASVFSTPRRKSPPARYFCRESGCVTGAGAVAVDRIGDEHFLPRNFRAAPADEAFDGIDRFRRLDEAHAIRFVAHHRRASAATENARRTA